MNDSTLSLINWMDGPALSLTAVLERSRPRPPSQGLRCSDNITSSPGDFWLQEQPAFVGIPYKKAVSTELQSLHTDIYVFTKSSTLSHL